MQYQGSARRSILRDSDLYVDAGSQSTANLLFDRPIDLTTHYASAYLRLFQTGNWKVSLRAGYISNVAGFLLAQLVGGLGGNGSVAPGAGVLQPFERTISNLNLHALTSVKLAYGLSLYDSADRTTVSIANNDGPGSSYFSTASGMTYTNTFR